MDLKDVIFALYPIAAVLLLSVVQCGLFEDPLAISLNELEVCLADPHLTEE